MIIFGMEAEFSAEVYERLLRKMAWMSSVLGEVDEWVESRPQTQRLGLAESSQGRVVTLENLDAHLARERR